MKRTLAILPLLATLSAGAALANDCQVSPEQMQSWKAMTQLANDYGWTISSMEMDDGCYELRVTDAGGNTIEAEVDPATLQVIEAELEDLASDKKVPTETQAPAN